MTEYDTFIAENLGQPMLFLAEQAIYKEDIDNLKQIDSIIGVLNMMINSSSDMDEIQSYQEQLKIAHNNYSDAVIKTGRFWTKAEAFNRTIHKITNDQHNCMFRALAVCMGRSEEEHLDIRHTIVNYGTLNFHTLDQNLMLSEGYPNGERYRDAMYDPFVWGGDIELIIATIIYNCCIVVIDDNGFDLTEHIFHKGHRQPSDYNYNGYTLFLIRNNQHYNSLI